LNGELFGRATGKWWGMYFADGLPGQGALRHPSQLYEAFFEGLVLFTMLWSWRNRSKFPGYLLLVYLFGYGFLRFFIEFPRARSTDQFDLWLADFGTDVFFDCDAGGSCFFTLTLKASLLSDSVIKLSKSPKPL